MSLTQDVLDLVREVHGMRNEPVDVMKVFRDLTLIDRMDIETYYLVEKVISQKNSIKN